MNWPAVSLELAVAGLAVVVLLADLFAPRGAVRRTGAGLHALATVGLAAILVASFRIPETAQSFTAAWVQDPFAVYVKRIVLATAALVALAAWPHAAARGWSRRSGEFLVLLLFAALGAMALTSARELLTLFVAFELLSVPTYALAALDKRRPEAPEGALKLFLFGSVSSALLLLGIGMLLASTGTTFWQSVGPIRDHGLFDLGVALVVAGFGFKIAMAPFYLWVPDTYQAAPTPLVAFLSIAPKAAAVAVLFRLYFELFEGRVPGLAGWLAVLSAVTMTVGNLLALPQRDLKRMLAFSGVAHVGYVLAALAAASRFGAGMALFYFVAYLLSNAGAFLALAAVEAGGEAATLDGVRNLVRRSPAIASALLVFLLSLGGIPFVLGFWGKMYVFLAAARAGLWWLVFLGALLAVVALFYYLNVARWMFIVKDDDAGPVPAHPAVLAAVLLCAVAVTLGGLVPAWFVEPALRAVGSL